MAYEKGMATIDTESYLSEELAIMLPHSCDEWVIGGPNEANDLISDLELLIAELEQRKRGAGVEDERIS